MASSYLKGSPMQPMMGSHHQYHGPVPSLAAPFGISHHLDSPIPYPQGKYYYIRNHYHFLYILKCGFDLRHEFGVGIEGHEHMRKAVESDSVCLHLTTI